MTTLEQNAKKGSVRGAQFGHGHPDAQMNSGNYISIADEEAFPRVLVVAAQALRKESGFGVTMSNLFQDYPASCVRQIFMDTAEPDPQICSAWWGMSISDIPGDHLIRPWLSRRGLVMGQAQLAAPTAQQAVGLTSDRTGSLLRSVLRAHAAMIPFHIRPELEQWVREFDPDIIFTILGNIRVSRLAVQLSERMDCPMLIYFLDDWVLTQYADTRLNLLPHWQLSRNVRRAVLRSPLLLGISETMAVEYRRRYNRPCEAFVNCVEIDEYTPAPIRSDGSVRFAYVGGLHLDRWRNLIELGNALGQLSASGGLQSRLQVYAPELDLRQYGTSLRRSVGIEVRGSLSAEEVPGVLKEADVLVHVESFLPKVVDFCRLSLSTKIPQYLAAGRPLLCYGPSILASNQYVQNHEAGLVVGKQDPAALLEATARLRDDNELRQRMGMNARRVAVRYHDAKFQRKRFQKILTDVARTKRPRTDSLR